MEQVVENFVWGLDWVGLGELLSECTGMVVSTIRSDQQWEFS